LVHHKVKDESGRWNTGNGLLPNNPLVMNGNGGNLGCLICLDVEKPTLVQQLIERGCNVLGIPAASDSINWRHFIEKNPTGAYVVVGNSHSDSFLGDPASLGITTTLIF